MKEKLRERQRIIVIERNRGIDRDRKRVIVRIRERGEINATNIKGTMTNKR